MAIRRVRSTARHSLASSSAAASSGARRRRMVSAATMLPLAIGLASTGLRPSAPATGTAPRLTCTLPFDAIKQHHPIDDTCGPDGNAASNSSHSMQNDAKNNFCAGGPPVNLTFQDFRQLMQEAAARVTYGSDSKLPIDRSLLRAFPSSAGTVGEGSVVRLAAFVLEGHYSNLGKGESVNCKKGDKASNDIHIVLEERANDTTPCDSVTAEMSPHWRPDLWDPSILNQYGIKENPTGPRLFRFTGQLFFDASHSPCSGGKGANPQRSSLWEIHPVYQVEVCADASNGCTVDNDANWQSLVDFASGNSTETRLKTPATGETPVWTARPSAIVPEL